VNKAASIKNRLKNLAQSQGRSYQNLLQTYALERTIYRLSISPYIKQFTLKGGIFLYGLFEGDFPRSTADIDLLGQHVSNDIDTLKAIFLTIFSISCDDGLDFALDTFDIRPITILKVDPGARLTITANLERTKILVTVDIGFGDQIIPEQVQMDFPVLLNDPVPKIYGYSKESVIAEKLEAITSLGNVNSRYKDFFDIFILAHFFSFSGELLQKAILETFTQRQTPFQPLIAFEDSFIEDPIHQRRWKAFITKKNVQTEAAFSEVIACLKIFLIPIIQSLQENKSFTQTWNPSKQSWEAYAKSHFTPE